MIWALHGFLGQGRDWEPFAEELRSMGYFEARAPDLFRRDLGGRSLGAWARDWTARIEREDPHPVLLGYSLGGRLALHALLEKPKLFRKAVIVSAGCGIEREEDRRSRFEKDLAWSDRFRRGHWASLMSEWNSQEVFSGQTAVFERREADYDRGALAFALREWSQARQDPLWARLHEIKTPLLWVVGEKDASYVAVAERARSQIPDMRLEIIPGAGHRAPWENHECFTRALKRFLLA